MAMLTELNAIFISSIAYIAMQENGFAFNFGYEYTGGTVSAATTGGVVFVQLLLELTTEVFVDHVAMKAEVQAHDIPVTYFYRILQTPFAFSFHACNVLATTVLTLYSFMPYPHAFACASPDVCADDCWKKGAGLEQVFNHTCTSLGNETVAASRQRSGDDIFRDVDLETVFLGIISLGAAVAAVWVSTVMMKKQRRLGAAENKVHAFTQHVAALEHELALTKKQHDQVEAAMRELNDRVNGVGRFQIPYSDIERTKKLGSGTFGDVWLANYTHMHVTAPVAVKKLKAERIDSFMLRKFQDEVELMSRLEHANIVGFVGMPVKLFFTGHYISD